MIGVVDSIVMMYASMTKQNFVDYCDIETNSLHTKALVAKDGSLVSIIEVQGAARMMGDDEFESASAKVAQTLSVLMAEKGHTLQSGFYFDPKTVGNELGRSFDRTRQSMITVGLDLNSLMNERQTHLPKYCSSEGSYIAFWTHTDLLTTNERKRIARNKSRMNKKAPPPQAPDAQSLTAEIQEIRERHRSAVEALMDEFDQGQIRTRLLDQHESVAFLRGQIDPSFTGDKWRAILLGDKIPARIGQKLRSRFDGSVISYPPLYEQIMPRDAERYDSRIIRVGSRLYYPVYVDIMPRRPQKFQLLFNRLNSSGIPYRINIQLGSEGLSAIGFRSTLAKFTAFTAHNKQITKAYDELRESMFQNQIVNSIRISIMTWVDGELNDERVEQLVANGSSLARSVENWGQSQVSEFTANPMQGVLSSAIGITPRNIGNPTCGPVNDFAEMLPFYRPAQAWSSGAMMLRTTDGKPYPFQPGSSLQDAGLHLVFAPPGKGKSVLLNIMNLALCLAPGVTELPYIHIIDIGPSSSGLISLLKDALPDNRKHEAAHFRMRMHSDFASNPFDVQLGMEKPLPLERSFLINILLVLFSPAGKEPYDGMEDLIVQVVDDAYRFFSPTENPKPYQPSTSFAIDQKLSDIRYQVDVRTTWWEVQDALFDAGATHEAMLAGRYAVPLLTDLVRITRQPQIMDMFRSNKAPTGEPLVDAFNRMVSGIIKSYPILAEPTKFDLGDARVVSIDLDEVAKGTGANAEKQISVCYMLARNYARHFYLHEDDLPLFKLNYRRYQERRITNIRSIPKHLCYDELHRMSKAGGMAQSLQSQLLLDMREGRKFNVLVTLLSQLLTDFSKDMIELSTCRFILGLGTDVGIKEVVDIFGLSESAIPVLRDRLNGPGPGGSNLYAIFDTKAGTFSQLLTATIGPEELWAYSTTPSDTALRRELSKLVPPSKARQLLAKRYPSGSAKKDIESRLNEMMVGSDLAAEEISRDLTADLAKEIADEQ